MSELCALLGGRAMSVVVVVVGQTVAILSYPLNSAIDHSVIPDACCVLHRVLLDLHGPPASFGTFSSTQNVSNVLRYAHHAHAASVSVRGEYGQLLAVVRACLESRFFPDLISSRCRQPLSALPRLSDDCHMPRR